MREKEVGVPGMEGRRVFVERGRPTKMVADEVLNKYEKWPSSVLSAQFSCKCKIALKSKVY